MINMVMVHEEGVTVNDFPKTNTEAFPIGDNVQPVSHSKISPSSNHGTDGEGRVSAIPTNILVYACLLVTG